MKVIVFGATGPTGRRAVDEALAKAHEVTGFVRDPSKLVKDQERLKVAQGDALDPASVEKALAGQDAVLVCLGARNRSGKGWPPRDIDFRATQNILAGMKKHGVKRLVCMLSLATIRSGIPGEDRKRRKRHVRTPVKMEGKDPASLGGHRQARRRQGAWQCGYATTSCRSPIGAPLSQSSAAAAGISRLAYAAARQL